MATLQMLVSINALTHLGRWETLAPTVVIARNDKVVGIAHRQIVEYIASYISHVQRRSVSS